MATVGVNDSSSLKAGERFCWIWDESHQSDDDVAVVDDDDDNNSIIIGAF